jgi:hypothetical protein
MSNVFCDDHEWVGEQGQSCPECDALHEMETAHLPTVKNLLPMPEVKPPREGPVMGYPGVVHVPKNGTFILDKGERVIMPCPECGPQPPMPGRNSLPVYDHYSQREAHVVVVHPKGKVSRLLGLCDDDLACLDEWNKEDNFGRAPTTREILDAEQLRPFDIYITTEDRDRLHIAASNVMARNEEDAVEVYRANTPLRMGKAHLIAKPTPLYTIGSSVIGPDRVKGILARAEAAMAEADSFFRAATAKEVPSGADLSRQANIVFRYLQEHDPELIKKILGEEE